MKKKIVSLVVVLALAATALVGTTLAYFTDTDNAENVFTVGNVKIDLTEPEWDKQGSVDAPEVYPGERLAKDPTIENIGANPCFVRVKVTGWDCLGDAGLITYRTDYVDGKLGTDWVYDEATDYFYYTKPLVVKGTETESWNEGLVSKTDALFDQIVMPTGLTNGYDGNYSLVVKAEAVQAQGAKEPNWAAVKTMNLEEIKAWFATCMA